MRHSAAALALCCLAPTALLALSPAAVLTAVSPEPIPYFARRYKVACTQCHVIPPKLNAFGQAFIANGYKMPTLRSEATWPFAVWVSSRADRPPLNPTVQDRLIKYINRVELISGGQLVVPWLSYFVEWRALSLGPRSDGTLKDRSGRFEDLFVTAATDRLEVFVGQFRQVQQVDISRRLGLSEPLVLSSSLPGEGGATPRKQSLRGFSPAGRSPAVRVGLVETFGGWRWTTAVAAPFPGEFSLPLTDEAKNEASNELELNPKGAMFESFVRRGLTSFGVHAFYDNTRRYLASLVTTGNQTDFYWTGIVGVVKRDQDLRARFSLEGEYVPIPFVGGGGRFEEVLRDGTSPTLVGYLIAHFPGTRYTVRLTLEQRFQAGENATLIQLGTVF